MLVLALDTSTPSVTAALVDTAVGVVAERVVVDGRRHGEVLTAVVREVLLAIRAVIDFALERMEARHRAPVEVEDIPIL